METLEGGRDGGREGGAGVAWEGVEAGLPQGEGAGEAFLLAPRDRFPPLKMYRVTIKLL